MGNSRFSSEAYTSYAADVKHTSRKALFSRRSATDEFKGGQNLNPEKIQFRESRDSEANPCSTPIMVGLDVSGSMGVIAEKMVKKGLGEFVGHVLERQFVADPHIMFMGIGDEEFPAKSSETYIGAILNGGCPKQGVTPEGLLEAARERYHVFHIVVAQGDYASRDVKRVESSWRTHLQKRVLTLIDYDYIGAVIAAAIAVEAGQDVEEVIESWSGPAQKVVRVALLGRNGQ